MNRYENTDIDANISKLYYHLNSEVVKELKYICAEHKLIDDFSSIYNTAKGVWNQVCLAN